MRCKEKILHAENKKKYTEYQTILAVYQAMLRDIFGPLRTLGIFLFDSLLSPSPLLVMHLPSVVQALTPEIRSTRERISERRWRALERQRN